MLFEVFAQCFAILYVPLGLPETKSQTLVQKINTDYPLFCVHLVLPK